MAIVLGLFTQHQIKNHISTDVGLNPHLCIGRYRDQRSEFEVPPLEGFREVYHFFIPTINFIFDNDYKSNINSKNFFQDSFRIDGKQKKVKVVTTIIHVAKFLIQVTIFIR